MSRLTQFKKSLKDSGKFFLIPELNAAILRTNKPRKVKYFHPSGLGNCDVKLVGQILEPELFKPVYDVQLLRIFGNGTKLHERIEENLRDTRNIVCVFNKKICIEYPLEHLKYFLRGTCDAIVAFNGLIYILEIKGLNERGFERAKAGDIEHSYKLQGTVYVAMAKSMGINAAGTLFLIESKNTQEQFEFILPFDEVLWNEQKKRLLKLKMCVQKKKMPVPAYPKDSYWCQNCDKYNYCWKR